MPERRGFRFALEVFFLAGLAAALTFANLRPLTIGGLMLLGWALVAALEWLTWRGEAHYGRGLPPRYYVPRTSLPEPRPLEQVWHGYPEPEQHDDAPTWIALPDLDSEVGGWPVWRPTVDEPSEIEPEFDPVQLLIPRSEPVEEAAVEDHRPAGAVLVASAVRLERHRIDPLREHERSRLPWRRGEDDDVDVAMVPARPEGLRVLPLSLQRED